MNRFSSHEQAKLFQCVFQLDEWVCRLSERKSFKFRENLHLKTKRYDIMKTLKTTER